MSPNHFFYVEKGELETRHGPCWEGAHSLVSRDTVVERQAYHSSWTQTAMPGVRTGAEEVSSRQMPSLLGGGGAEGAGIRTENQLLGTVRRGFRLEPEIRLA